MDQCQAVEKVLRKWWRSLSVIRDEEKVVNPTMILDIGACLYPTTMTT